MKKIDRNILISVIIPCYNSGRTLKQSINSILLQSWKNIEIIVVNDGSDDKFTLNVLKDITTAKVFTQQNKGLPSARNFGVSKAKGDYIFFLDADDTIENNSLNELISTLIINKTEGFSFPKMKLRGDRFEKIENQYNPFEQLFLNKIPYSIMISKNLFNKVGGYSENLIYGYEDWELNIRLGSKNIFGFLAPKATLNYNVSNSGMLKSKSIKFHGIIWRQIQNINRSSYTIKNFIDLYKCSKNIRSANWLGIYFIYYFIWKITPIKLFNFGFKTIDILKTNIRFFKN